MKILQMGLSQVTIDLWFLFLDDDFENASRDIEIYNKPIGKLWLLLRADFRTGRYYDFVTDISLLNCIIYSKFKSEFVMKKLIFRI